MQALRIYFNKRTQSVGSRKKLWYTIGAWYIDHRADTHMWHAIRGIHTHHRMKRNTERCLKWWIPQIQQSLLQKSLSCYVGKTDFNNRVVIDDNRFIDRKSKNDFTWLEIKMTDDESYEAKITGSINQRRIIIKQLSAIV